MENLTALYKKLAMLIHPDKGGSTRDMQQLNKAYNIFKHLSTKYLKEQKESNEIDQESFSKKDNPKIFRKTVDPSFRFPYPPCTFRIEDTIKVTENGKSKNGVIKSITKNEDGMFMFVLDFGTSAKAELKTYIREDEQASEDPNFYLFKARWEEPTKF